ncbi:MAG: M1 family aminopeptidase [Bacteroidota bacterium]|nr:M1 family aminopeptidase [Bacteroidota bacterium]MDP4233095.1 M1 family aminopeptidase [Bacteroidota bacterium]MDP4287418.1 M1 family aminopeptidase [Bacteroidota bacterium]
MALAQQQVLPSKRPYTVISYKLSMDWRPMFRNKNELFSGMNEITVSTTQSEIVFDAMEMRIDSITVSGRSVTPVPQPVDDTLTVQLGTPNPSPFPIKIFYTRTSDTNDAMFFYPKGLYVGKGPIGDSVFVEEDLAYTMSEPSDAHKWMPCNDDPYQKANSSISITVPAGRSAQSNGTLQSTDTNGDGSLTFNWVSDRPIATYLMCASASTWAEWRDYYHRVSNPLDSVPVVYFAWPADYAATDTTGIAHNARYAFRNTPGMLEAFSRLFGEYPFLQYGQVPVQPFGYGGMEHQTMTTIDRSILHGRDEDVIAHELFHQWFGDKTTCETWADIWLNEGFATLGEALWEESRRGRIGYDSIISGKAHEFFHPYNNSIVNNIAIYNPPVAGMFAENYLTVYNKPGLMLHMLRRILNNDTLFFNTLRDYSNAFAYTTANTFQFMDYVTTRVGALAPMELSTFFNQWLFWPDWPQYNIGWKQSGNNLLFHISQTQNPSHIYTEPLRFYAISGLDTMLVTFVNDKQSQLFTAQVNKTINKIVFDTEATTLSQVIVGRDPSLDVQAGADQAGYLRVQVELGSLTLMYAPVIGDHAELEILDVLGRIIERHTVATGSTTLSFSTQALASGVYFIRMSDGAGEHTASFQVEK